MLPEDLTKFLRVAENRTLVRTAPSAELLSIFGYTLGKVCEAKK